MPKKQFIIALMCLLLGSLAFSQVRRDLASWSSIELGYKINNDWKLGLEGQYRLKGNLKVEDQYFAELSLKRKLTRNFDVVGGLRYARFNDDQGNIQGYQSRLRWQTDVLYGTRVGDLKIGLRLRYQNRGELGRIDNDPNVQRLRLKTALEYKIEGWPLDPEVSGELFSRFEKGEATKVDRYRVTLGTQYDVKKAGSFGAFWRIESSIGETIKDNIYILGLSYSYTFKN